MSKTRDANKAKDSMGTGKNPMCTSDLYTSDDRSTIRIPKNSKIHEFLYVHNSDKRAVWKRLDALLSIAQLNEEQFLIQIWDDFVTRASIIAPTKTKEIEKMRPLFFRKILKGEKLDEWYWEELKK